ncbi:hypothetical protein O3Q51_17365 [Cryomorphaceae bacterium 1068]|nr:hypothetical protein [Cryomorphaceae bacterium 1068]
MTNSSPELQGNKLVEKADYDLIKGDFTPEEALEILNYLIDKKINFHELKTFSTEIRFGQVHEKSVKRTEELKQSKTAIKELIQLAEEKGKTLRLKSSVTIEFL